MIIGYDAKRIYHNATGLGNYCRDLIRILSSDHPEHRYLLYNPKQGKVDRFEAEGPVVQEKRPSGIWKMASSLWRQGAILKQAQSDGVQIFHGLSGELPRGLGKYAMKSVVTIHDLIFVTHPHLYQAIDRKIYFNKFKYASDHADVIIAISDYTKQQIIKYLDADPSKIKVIYQTCHPLFKEEKAKTYGDYILMVGTLEERKNAHTLIKAIRQSDYQIKLVGRRTSYTDGVIEFIDQNNLGNQVEIIDTIAQDDLVALYRGARLLCYTSLVEGFGIPIIEALYTKTPVMCHNEGVFAEAAGPSSVKVDMNNPQAIRQAIDVLWNDEHALKEMSDAGYRYAQNFDDHIIAEQVMSVYQNLNSIH